MRINLLQRSGVALLALAAFSQTQNSQPDTPMLRVTVNLVQVDAVVTDSKGNQVTDLTANDFQLFQDGKQQKITHFSYISTAPPTAPPPANAPRVTPLKGMPAPPPMKLRPDPVRHTVAMAGDELVVAS